MNPAFLLSTPALVCYALIAAWLWHKSEVKHAVDSTIAEATAKEQARVSEFVVAMSEREAKRQAEDRAQRAQQQERTVFLTKEVPVYVSKLADARCTIPAGFVWHHDAAWNLSQLPAAAGGSVDQPSGVLLSRVESVNTCNAGAALTDRAEVIRWRQWYADNKSRFDAFARGNGSQPDRVSQPNEKAR